MSNNPATLAKAFWHAVQPFLCLNLLHEQAYCRAWAYKTNMTYLILDYHNITDSAVLINASQDM